ncbi:hypothetical protein [Actinacidiphila rubida]|uniref:Lipoprotein n=1 Tax=Actinacidiphila rubida TaxID=310780 RepID=A0A1H8T0K6_9ACTN|nr:hypothetical protein [Actinacidiphila rubida]SEO84003.1 hypothetical protein SAMN05216267_104679 [Actinacidiphila rubida]
MYTRTATAAAGLLLATGALTACSSSSHDAKPTTTTPGTVAAKPTTAPASEAPIPDTALAKGKTAACWKAIRDQYTPGTMQLTGAPTTPPACASLTSDEISAVAEDVLAHQLDG